jgi:hypothetical protein
MREDERDERELTTGVGLALRLAALTKHIGCHILNSYMDGFRPIKLIGTTWFLARLFTPIFHIPEYGNHYIGTHIW